MKLYELLAMKLNKEILSAFEEFALLEAEVEARAYLNYKKDDELNLDIRLIVANMALQKIKLKKAESGEAGGENLKSISMGDTEYSFYEKDARKNYDSAMFLLKEELRAFRRCPK